MHELSLIKDTVDNVADAITAILELETEIVDCHLQIISGTGRFSKKIGAYEEGGDINSPYIYGKVLRSGIDYICEDCSTDPIYGAKEEELAEICCPILVRNDVVGLIGLISLTEKQRAAMLERAPLYLNFLREMSILIAGKLVETQSNNKLSSLIDNMPYGLIATERDGTIFSCNFSGELLLEKSRNAIIGKKLSDFFPDEEQFSHFGAHDMEDSEMIYKVGGNVKRVLTTAVPIADSVTMYIMRKSSSAMGLTVQQKEDSGITFSDIYGNSPQIQETRKIAYQVADSNSTLLITGESGTGKELFARAIHNSSNRRKYPFISINCGAIPETLLESELFGYEKGAFTGASSTGKIGKFELADNGTIFLDEIGDLPFHMQVKLLRFLQNREVERIGSTHAVPVDVRIIAATNKSLEDMIARNEFRRDLYYRLNVISLRIPPLRERTDDVELLIYNLLHKFNGILDKNIEGFTAEALEVLKAYSWPGNIRELENTVEYAVNVTNSSHIKPENLPERIMRVQCAGVSSSGTPIPSQISGSTLKSQLEQAERSIISNVLSQTGDDRPGKKKASEILGISESSLYRKIRELGI